MKTEICIPTGMYSNDAGKILNAICAAMKSSFYVQGNFRNVGLRAISFERAPDNEIFLKLTIGDGWGRTGRFWKRIVVKSFYYTDDRVEPSEANAVLGKLGMNIKLLAHGLAVRDMDAKGKLNRADDAATWRDRVNKYFNKHIWHRNGGFNVKKFWSDELIDETGIKDMKITIGDLYFIYEKLTGRLGKNIKHYDNAVVFRLIGMPLDPISTELERARREEIDRITEEYAAKIDARTPVYNYEKSSPAYYELQKLIENFNAKCAAECEALRKERDAKLAEVRATYRTTESCCK